MSEYLLCLCLGFTAYKCARANLFHPRFLIWTFSILNNTDTYLVVYCYGGTEDTAYDYIGLWSRRQGLSSLAIKILGKVILVLPKLPLE